MPSVAKPDAKQPRVAMRCDGDERIGAGHVARCIPLAGAFAELGWNVAFVGCFKGVAEQLLRHAAVADTRRPDPSCPCGVRAREFDAAVVDSYAIEPSAMCALAGTLPIATLAEANRCPTRGVLLDYHLDRFEPSSARLLAGPRFAPLPPAIAGVGRAAEEIGNVLVTMGGSLQADPLIERIAPIVGSAFPDARILISAGAVSETFAPTDPRFVRLPFASPLHDVLGILDAAITAAGWTSYELACAGVPQLAIATAPNQRRVINGMNMRDCAICLELTGADAPPDLRTALRELADPARRIQLAARGMRVLDGRGASRAARALGERWKFPTYM